ncbi:phage tail sheath C-terminal domain-containing protein [Clostridium tagluense]|uniref:phage tail sheath C-terminal domain-containing protein n=1 Tax=Clostridium tagluense TaxID=360422 RepID=UPI001C6F3E91|nr:phage tail sheath C-terminal domain-containing protein [Clostridium tagluense]MBW9159347.1 phage tail sheath subtilisin-like domain-containing protein [Clostridium tagluense]WLC68078.1 phage tail sheath subtilisin-like domain-containing protein [Clostridium tagluense]
MGLPNINIIFKEAAGTFIKRGNRGTVALILKDEKCKAVLNIETMDDIPDTLSPYNKNQIQLALMGTVNPPSKVIAFVQGIAEDFSEAKNYLETAKFDYLAVPGVDKVAADNIAQWIKNLRMSKGFKVKAILPNCATDSEGVINFATEDIMVGTEKFAAKDYCSRIAGVLAGLPLNISSTYQVLREITDVPHLSKSDFDKAVDDGKLVLINDGEKVKIARGVNSLVTTTSDKGEDFKKIKIVETMDMIHNDIKNMSEDTYIGKVPNTYDNKSLLITSIKGYYEELENEQLLDKGHNVIDIDIEAQKRFLKAMGQNVQDMKEQEIKWANTRDKVFLISSIKIVDAMEDINLNINM